LKPDVLKPDVLKPDVLKPDVLWVYQIVAKSQLNISAASLQIQFSLQGADDKLGQFLDQDIEATANHRNVWQYSLESYPSLVLPNVNKPSIFTKICR
jgi:hypothetical protein